MALREMDDFYNGLFASDIAQYGGIRGTFGEGDSLLVIATAQGNPLRRTY